MDGMKQAMPKVESTGVEGTGSLTHSRGSESRGDRVEGTGIHNASFSDGLNTSL